MRIEVKLAHETRMMEHVREVLVMPDDLGHVVDIGLEREDDGTIKIRLTDMQLELAATHD